MKAKQMLKRIDFYGGNINFLVESNSDRVNSPYGGIMSIITFCFLVFSFIVFGQDFYYKLNPKLIIQDKLMGNEEVAELINSGIANKTIVFKASKFLVDISNFLIDIAVPYTYYEKKIYQLLEFCSEEYVVNTFYAGNYTFASTEINKTFSYLCYDIGKHQFGLNNDQESNSQLIIPISIWSFKCGKTAQGIKGRDCPAGIDLINDKLATLEIWTDEVLYNQDSISSPFYSTMKRVTKIILSRSQIAATWLTIKMHWSYDNLGFMLDSYTDRKDFGASEVYSLSIMTPQPNSFYDFTLYAGLQRKYVKYSRTYMKFQDLLAIVGGVVKSVFTFFQILLFFVNDKNIKSLLINKMQYDVAQPVILNPLQLNQSMMMKIKDNNLDKSNAQLDQSNTLPLKSIKKNNYIIKEHSQELPDSTNWLMEACCFSKKAQAESLLYEYASRTQRIDSLTSTYKIVEVIASHLFNKEQLSALKYVKSSQVLHNQDGLSKSQLRSMFESKNQLGQSTSTDLLFLKFLN